jgi:DNA-binding PadR family transcriptional regulator
MWVLIALQREPRRVAGLLDDVRSLDGPIGHGTLYAAVARLERLTLIESTSNGNDQPAYRLTRLGQAAAWSVAAIHSEARA